MTFVRLAGCNVGRAFTDTERINLQMVTESGLEPLPVWAERCTGWDGKAFCCDTDYRVKSRITEQEIVAKATRKRICLTGGEPLIHDLGPLLKEAWDRRKCVHIETSGTKSV